jgi:hypothetical protein
MLAQMLAQFVVFVIFSKPRRSREVAKDTRTMSPTCGRSERDQFELIHDMPASLALGHCGKTWSTATLRWARPEHRGRRE